MDIFDDGAAAPRRAYIRPVHKRGESLVVPEYGAPFMGRDVLTGFALTTVPGDVLVDEHVLGHFVAGRDARQEATETFGVPADQVGWGDVLWV